MPHDLPEPAPEHPALAELLVKWGCPAEKTPEMAVMLEKRARQLSNQTGRPYADALRHLLSLMRQGWAAKDKGLP